MADMYVINKSTLTAIGDSIREMTGRTTDTFAPGDMPTAIRSIEGGGGGTSSDERVKYVTFMQGDTELYKYPVIVGDTCKDPYNLKLIDEPKKEQTVSTVYSFNGWSLTDGGSASSSALANVTENRKVYAAFKPTARTYLITYYDTDGTWLYEEYVAYNTVPSYTPEKAGEAFDKWTPTPVAVTGDASYTASWRESIANGSITDTVLWNVTGAGALEIYGTGATPDYTYSTQDTVPYYAYADQITSVVVKDGITRIGDRTLSGSNLKNVVSVTFADSVTTLGDYTCYAMHALERVSLGTGLTYIEGDSFSSCDKLSAVNITDVGMLFNLGFYGYTNNPIGVAKNLYLNDVLVTDLVVPEGVTAIKDYLFYNCKSLTSVTIPDSVTSIGQWSFKECSSLANVYVGRGLSSIGNDAFDNVSPAIWVDENNTTFSSDASGVLYDKNKATLIKASNNVTDYAIPSSVTSISSKAFYRCTSLTGVTIPSSVESIGSYAFSQCTSLTGLTIPDSVTSEFNGWVAGCTALTSIHIGSGITSIKTYACNGCNALTKATFGNTSGWYVTKTQNATSGTNLTLTNNSTNATYLKTTYSSYYWYKK